MGGIVSRESRRHQPGDPSAGCCGDFPLASCFTTSVRCSNGPAAREVDDTGFVRAGVSRAQVAPVIKLLRYEPNPMRNAKDRVVWKV